MPVVSLGQPVQLNAAPSGRLTSLDALRGIALVGMIAYHFCFNLDSLFLVSLPWFHSTGAAVWQLCNCALFLVLAGICTHFTRRIFRRAALLAAVAAGLSLATLLFMPQEVIVFGILHCMAVCMLLFGVFRPWLTRIPPWLGMLIFGALFAATYHLPHQYLFFQPYALPLPAGLYTFYPLSLLGFQSATFFSSDYFPLIPYCFLFLFGHYLGYVFFKLPRRIQLLGWRPLNFLGRHSLLVYLLHQPILFGGMTLLL